MLGDHGLYLKGPHFYEEAIRVPLCLQYPDQFESGICSEAFVELIDLVPTLCEAVGIPVERQMQGKSFLPICTGAAEEDHHRDTVYCEYTNSWSHQAYGTMLRTQTHKIVVYHGTDQGELYDLVEDPDEFNNLWSDPEFVNLKSSLVKQAFDANVLTMDPMPERFGAF